MQVPAVVVRAAAEPSGFAETQSRVPRNRAVEVVAHEPDEARCRPADPDEFDELDRSAVRIVADHEPDRTVARLTAMERRRAPHGAAVVRDGLHRRIEVGHEHTEALPTLRVDVRRRRADRRRNLPLEQVDHATTVALEPVSSGDDPRFSRSAVQPECRAGLRVAGRRPHAAP